MWYSNARFRKALRLAASSALLAISLSSCASLTHRCLSDQAPVPRAQLDASSTARRAFAVLVATQEFASAHVDFAGLPSCQVVAFQRLLGSEVADTAFKKLLSQATPEGQLYALSGLYFTDPVAFASAAQRYASDTSTVTTLFGCVTESKPISEIVRSAHAVPPAELTVWHSQNPLAEYPPVDIVSGGWPTEFKNAFKRQ